MSTISNRYEFVIFFDVENGNPNGDPDAGNMPRIDPETGYGLVTDVCLKRKIRNYVETAKEREPGYRIYVKDGVPLNRSDAEACAYVGVEPDKLKEAKKKDANLDAKIRDFMCRNFYDIRTFGAVMTTFVKGALNCGQVRGPVQLGFARSVDPIVPQEVTITRVAITTEADAEKKGTETALFQERKNARRQSQKLVQEFFAQCRVLKESERPSSPVAQAISYALNIEAELKKFLKDSRLNIDNNPAERLNRGIAIIRKNCLFAGSEAGGQRLAILYSFAATCKANGICFRKWLKDVLPRLNSTPAGQINSLILGEKQSCQ